MNVKVEMENDSQVTTLRYKRLKFGKKFSILNKTLLIVSCLCGILLLAQSFNLLQERTRCKLRFIFRRSAVSFDSISEKCTFLSWTLQRNDAQNPY